MKNIVFVFGLLAALLSLQVQAAAGRFQFVSGDVKVTSTAGKERIAHKGDEVNEGESITSAGTATAQVKMKDDGLIIVRPDTKLRITTFQFNGKADGSERSLITLVKGGFRALTGMIGSIHKDNYKIETPTATIGIRGTDHEPMFIPNPAPGHVALAEPGTYDKVNSGAAVLSTARGMIVINPNHAGFVPNMVNAAPIVLSVIPKFYLPPSKDEPAILPGASLQPVGTQAGSTANTGSTSTTTATTTTTTSVPIRSTAVISPVTSTLSTAVISPAATTSTLSTAVVAPVDTTTITKTAISPAVTTSTLSTAVIAPAPTTTTLSTAVIAAPTPSTLSTAVIAPAPTTSTISTTAVIAPTTTVAPTTTTVKQITISPSLTVSDRRLKMNIKRIGTHNLGIGIYEFDYIWGQHAIGVMADEVKLVRPEAVFHGESGYDLVDYSKLN